MRTFVKACPAMRFTFFSKRVPLLSGLRGDFSFVLKTKKAFRCRKAFVLEG